MASAAGLDPRRVQKRLLGWYGKERRDLPWRASSDPYRVWVSEIMLQQTRVETVIPYFERFLARFPTVEALAGANLDDVLALWSGLGYYRRARLLHRGARHVLQEHSGRFPDRLADALAVPGVGTYTAGAILSIAHGARVPVVDGNVERVLSRVLRLAGDPKRGATARRLREVAESLVPRRAPGDFNQALMELGATVCTPRSPGCDDCPLRADCAAVCRGDQESFPQLAPRRALEPVSLQAAVVARRGRYLLQQVSGHPFLDGLWMFPFVEATRPEALVAHVHETAGARLELGPPLPAIRHSITFRKITAHPVRLGDSPTLSTRGRPALRWCRLAELGERVAVSSLALKIRRSVERAI